MPAWLKGFVLAMATLVVNAIGLGMAFRVDPFECGGNCSDAKSHLSLAITFFGTGVIPCTAAGVGLGRLAGASARHARWLRWLVLASLSVGVVLLLASMANLLDFALVSAIPTLAAVTALERWTRAPRELPVAPARVFAASVGVRDGSMPAWSKGFVLAMATLAVNAIGLGMAIDRDLSACGHTCTAAERHISLAVMLFVIGFIPCMLAGVALGWIAGVSARVRWWSRWVLLALLSGTVVIALAAALELLQFAAVSAIPTLAAVTALERWTRAARDLPMARAR